MSLRPFFDAGLIIQTHEISAIIAFVLGAIILWHRKGSLTHKRLGKIWVVLMLGTALSSLFIYEIRLWGQFSPIHLLTVMVLFNIPLAVWFARQGKIGLHKKIMQGTYLGGMIIAGGFTLFPGRLNYKILFDENGLVHSNPGLAIVVVSVFLSGVLVFLKNKFAAN